MNKRILSFAAIFVSVVFLFTACVQQPISSISVELNNTGLTLEAGQTSQLNATILLNGEEVDEAAAWSTSNAAVATVSGGLVTAVSIGTADITASYNNVSATCVVTVVETAVGGIKNIILMIGDGMGPNQEEAARIYSGKPLAWDDFPYSGKVTTNDATNAVTNSAEAGTALSTGTKTTGSYIKRDEFGNDKMGIIDYARLAGKKTGVVSSKFLFDATPAAFSAYSDIRQDYDVIKSSQVVSGIDLLIGEASSGYSNYTNEIEEAGYEYITTAAGLKNFTGGKLFAPLPSIVPNATSSTQIELEYLTRLALNHLDNEEGFVLMVEGGKIDGECHAKNIMGAINEVLAFSEAVEAAVNWAKNRSDTIVVVTADHETGGLLFTEGVNGDNIATHVYWSNSVGDGAEHTGTNVNYNIYGDIGEDVEEMLTPIIDNTDIFRICKSFVAGDEVIFNVPKTGTAVLNEEYAIPAVTATHGDDEYTAVLTVRDSTRALVVVSDNKFTPTNTNEYMITYTVTINGVAFSKNTWIQVMESAPQGIGFETSDDDGIVYNDAAYLQSTNATDRGVTVSRVAYADAGITAPANGGSYGIKMTPLTSNPLNFVAFYINIDRPVQVGMQVTFSFYIQVDSLADRYSVRHNDNRDTSVTDSTTINQWVTVTFTFVPKSPTQITENDNPNSIQCRVRFYDSNKDKTTINMYIDNLTVIDP